MKPANLDNTQTFEQVTAVVISCSEEALSQEVYASLDPGLVTFINTTDHFEAVEAARENRPCVFLLDFSNSQLAVLSALEFIQSRTTIGDIPVIPLVASAREIDRLLERGVVIDDFIRLPVDPDELVIRLRLALGRSSNHKPKDTPINVGPVTIYPAKYEVLVDGQAVRLTRREFDLLHVLARAKDRVFTRDEILNQAWGRDVYVQPRSVTTTVSRLKQNLGKGGWILQNMYGVGYRVSDRDPM